MASKWMVFFSVFTLMGLTLISGCGGGTSYVTRTNFVEFSPEQLQEIDNSDLNVYRIQEGDIFTLAFSYLKELKQDNVIVLADGSVNLIGVDRVALAGLSIAEADSVITHRYSLEYRDPDLSLLLQETMGRRVYVLGEVTHPGLHKLPQGGIDMMGAVAVAGGFTEDAAEEGSVLVRVTDTGYLCQEVDLSGFHSVEFAELAMVHLSSYDVIYVPRSRIGDFSYFSKSVLTGITSMTQIAANIYYLSGGQVGRF